MERLHKLLFELSSSERLRIMLQLQKGDLKLSHVSRKLGLTVTETSRHLQRLSGATLIQKEVDGQYALTQFGRLALFLMEDLSFVSNHRDFFLEYDVCGIPNQLIDRFGELEGAVYVGEALRNLEEGEKSIREAKDFVWILSDDILTNTIQPLKEKIKVPFDLRILLPEGKFPPENISQLPAMTPGIQKRVLPKVNVLVVMTENFAVLCLPNRSGKIDYTGFSGKDNRFLTWCKELFLHYWEKANPSLNKLKSS